MISSRETPPFSVSNPCQGGVAILTFVEAKSARNKGSQLTSEVLTNSRKSSFRCEMEAIFWRMEARRKIFIACRMDHSVSNGPLRVEWTTPCPSRHSSAPELLRPRHCAYLRLSTRAARNSTGLRKQPGAKRRHTANWQ
jgi:hypothetical protein